MGFLCNIRSTYGEFADVATERTISIQLGHNDVYKHIKICDCQSLLIAMQLALV